MAYTFGYTAQLHNQSYYWHYVYCHHKMYYHVSNVMSIRAIVCKANLALTRPLSVLNWWSGIHSSVSSNTSFPLEHTFFLLKWSLTKNILVSLCCYLSLEITLCSKLLHLNTSLATKKKTKRVPEKFIHSPFYPSYWVNRIQTCLSEYSFSMGSYFLFSGPELSFQRFHEYDVKSLPQSLLPCIDPWRMI